jgi:hypothetical protein
MPGAPLFIKEYNFLFFCSEVSTVKYRPLATGGPCALYKGNVSVSRSQGSIKQYMPLAPGGPALLWALALYITINGKLVMFLFYSEVLTKR